jgi:hypothetical protein
MAEDVAARIDLLTKNSEEVSQQALQKFWESLGLASEESGYFAFEDAFLIQVSADRPEELNFSPGGWVAKVTGPLAKTAIISALLAIALAASHAIDISALVIPAIAPLLFDLEKVRLTRSEEQILIELTLKQDARTMTVEELYAALPASIQDQVAPLAFQDFLEKCRTAGLADVTQQPASVVNEPKYQLRPPGAEHFRITIV